MKISSFQKSLLRWYSRHARDLPWRRTRDPYAIWVSEIMLQQTQVSTVIPYYEKWLRRFPTLKSLAQAPLDSALHAWAGLGYYRRARMLHQGAREVLQKWGGRIPERIEDLQKIPGIGRYTAGAIASIAFEQKAPLLDGNVIRVFSRLRALRAPVDQTSTLRQLWLMAERLLPGHCTGDFNQALMELGSQVCTPQSPACPSCPVRRHCKAYANKCPDAYPVKSTKEKITRLREQAFILERNGRVLIKKQTGKDRWCGLWVFPMLKGFNARPSQEVLRIRHAFTRYQIDLRVYQPSAGHKLDGSKEFYSRQWKWVKIQDLKRLAFPSPHRKIADYILSR